MSRPGVEPAEMPGVVLFQPRCFEDSRGYFFETWNRDRYLRAGLPPEFVQDNLSCSHPGVLRGLHFQNPGAQGKLVGVLQGEVFDVAVDLRRGSPTFGRWTGALLSAENHHQLYIPEGFAHGFQVTRGPALFLYKCTAPYLPHSERTLRWNDPEIGIEWPLAGAVVSDKDAAGLSLKDAPPAWLFEFRG